MATISEARDVRDFSEIVLQGYGDIILEQIPGPGIPESLVIEGEESLVAKVGSRVCDNRLFLGFDMPWWEWLTFWFTWLFTANKKLMYRLRIRSLRGVSILGNGSLTAPRIETDQCTLRVAGSGRIAIDQLSARFLAAHISGSGRINVPGISTQTLMISISGSGDTQLAGTAVRQEIRISGSGRLKASGLQTRETTVNISGSGNVATGVSHRLDVKISGSGSVRYAGTPKVTQHISGSGRVEPIH